MWLVTQEMEQELKTFNHSGLLKGFCKMKTSQISSKFATRSIVAKRSVSTCRYFVSKRPVSKEVDEVFGLTRTWLPLTIIFFKVIKG